MNHAPKALCVFSLALKKSQPTSSGVDVEGQVKLIPCTICSVFKSYR